MTRHSPRAPNELPSLTLRPIGVVRTPHLERATAPRQPRVASSVRGEIVLVRGMNLEDAIADLATWKYLWVIFWFHLNAGWRPKVLPPRERKRRGVLSTRSPHRPNPIGLSVVELERIEGLTLHVKGVDMVDQTPVLDIKPYVPYVDAITGAKSGWLDAPPDPRATFEVRFAELARAELDFLRDEHAIEGLERRIVEVLELGPQPHAYRRIRAEGPRFRLALKEWRVWFRVDASVVIVEHVGSGYRASELVRGGKPLAPHRALIARFGDEGLFAERPAR